MDHQECVDEPAHELADKQEHESEHASSLGEGENNVSLDNYKNFLLTSFTQCTIVMWKHGQFFLVIWQENGGVHTLTVRVHTSLNKGSTIHTKYSSPANLGYFATQYVAVNSFYESLLLVISKVTEILLYCLLQI